MSYFKITNYNTLNNSHLFYTNDNLLFEDIKIYINFIINNYNIKKENNDVNELIEIFSQLKINYKESNITFSKGIKNLKENFKNNINDNILYVSNELDKNILNNNKFILRVDNLLDYKTIEYIYNILIMYDNIIIYNCYISNVADYRIYIICDSINKERKKYGNIKNIPYLFIKNIKTIYYQIIQDRINTIKTGKIKDKLNIWKSLYIEI